MISDIYQKKFSAEGFDVLIATSGDQVLSMAKKEKVDVILLDLVFPKMDGFAVVENLRNGKYDPNIKIIIFSNLSEEENRKKVMDLGADDFIVKSKHTPSEMVEKVKEIVNK